jgi:hypothetical protein
MSLYVRHHRSRSSAVMVPHGTLALPQRRLTMLD